MLDIQQQILIEQRISNLKPSAGVAYVLAIFLGVFGAHRFYLKRTGSAVAMLLLSITLLGLVVTSIWTLVDLFLIPGMIREDIDRLRQQLTLEVTSGSRDTTPQGAPSPAGGPAAGIPG
ncbi:MAG TPA: TM2 domain-containing protein [Rhizomicrobium sp.]|jgi:TM2 domain-containing membrane protein YozV